MCLGTNTDILERAKHLNHRYFPGNNELISLDVEIKTVFIREDLAPSVERMKLYYNENYYSYETRVSDYVYNDGQFYLIDKVNKQIILSQVPDSIQSHFLDNMFINNLDSLYNKQIVEITSPQDTIIQLEIISDYGTLSKGTIITYTCGINGELKSYRAIFAKHPVMQSLEINFISARREKILPENTIQSFLATYIKGDSLLSPYSDYQLFNYLGTEQ